MYNGNVALLQNMVKCKVARFLTRTRASGRGYVSEKGSRRIIIIAKVGRFRPSYKMNSSSFYTREYRRY